MPLPELPAERILAAHAAGTALVRDAGLVPEPPEVALAAERHRWAWAPSEIRVILIAESPVYTSPQDFTLRVRREWLPTNARHAPSEFVRLIYCLGYGKNALLTGIPERVNEGTPQFWSYFGRLAGTLPAASNAAANWDNRVDWEVKTLLALQAAGVWLLDASTHSVYLSRRKRLPDRPRLGLHRIWWESYGRWLLEQLPGAKRWIIGKTVRDELEKLRVPFDGWIYQPQAGQGGAAASSGWKRTSPSCSPQTSPTGRPRRSSPRAALGRMPPSRRERRTCSSASYADLRIMPTWRPAVAAG